MTDISKSPLSKGVLKSHDLAHLCLKQVTSAAGGFAAASS